MLVKAIQRQQMDDWLALRQQLYVETSVQQLATEAEVFLGQPERYAQFLAYDGEEQPIALIELSIRTDYVNGTQTSPVAFLEGIYVQLHWRRQGIAQQLLEVAAQWALSKGVSELASDVDIDNHASQAFHQVNGFDEVERVVCYCKRLS